MNPLLARKLRRLKLDEHTPPDAKTWQKLLSRLDSTLEHNDQTLTRLDRSLKLSSEEMQDIYATLRLNEQKIHQQRDQLDAVLDAVPAGICAISPEGELLFMNKAGHALLDDAAWQPQDDKLDATAILPLFYTGTQNLSVNRVFEMLGEQHLYQMDHCTLSHGEQDIPVSIHLSTLEHDIKKGFVVMAFQDISERLRNEKVNQEAQKMAVIGNLVGGIAHELNNMLASITGNLFLAKTRLVGHEDVLKRLDVAERLSFDMGDIIAHLMAFSGQSVVSRENISFKTLVEQAIVQYAESLPGNVVFGYDICHESLEIFAAEEQLQQILHHLLKNAADATMATTLPTIQAHLTLYKADADFSSKHQLEENSYFAKLSIQDNGCGIADQALPHIFEPFYTCKDFGGGKGLGLSMVQGAVQMHNGIIEVESELNRGSRFDIYLPLNHQEASLVEVTQEQTTPNVADQVTSVVGQSILLVEDDVDVRNIGKALLESLGYTVMTANDGVEGVEMYQQYQQDIGLVLMDIMMPRMNGTLACQKIRELNHAAKVIFVSGFDQHSTQLKEMGLANELFLSKPYNIMELHKTILREMGEG